MSSEDQQEIIAVIDFETLSTAHNAQVLSLAITWFKAGMVNTIYQLQQQTVSWNFRLEGQEHRKTDEDTKQWWAEQSEEAQNAHRMLPLYHPETVLQLLQNYVDEHNIVYLIGNGIGFDNVLLKNLCEDYNVNYPVKYWGDLDLRTLRWLSTMERPEFPGDLVKHIASNDTIVEALEFQKYYSHIHYGHG